MHSKLGSSRLMRYNAQSTLDSRSTIHALRVARRIALMTNGMAFGGALKPHARQSCLLLTRQPLHHGAACRDADFLLRQMKAMREVRMDRRDLTGMRGMPSRSLAAGSGMPLPCCSGPNNLTERMGGPLHCSRHRSCSYWCHSRQACRSA